MACQPGTASGAAPASIAAAHMSACLPESVGRGSLVTKDPREVCRLSPWDHVAVKLNPYPAHYRPAFACSLIPSRRPLGFSCELLSRLVAQPGRRWAYHVPP